MASSSSSSSSSSASPALDVGALLHDVQAALVPLTRTASQLPAASDLGFHRSLNPLLAATLDAHSTQLLALVNDLTAWVSPAAAENSALRSGSLNAVLAGNVPRAIGDIVDSLLERADINLDEYTGKREPRAPAFTVVKGKKGKEKEAATAADANGKGKAAQQNLPALPAHILNAPIKKPQRLFTTKPDNRSNLPWSRPLKFGKPHAAVPLDQSGPNRPGGPDPRQIWKKPKTRSGMWLSEGDAEDNYYFHEIVNAELPAHALEERVPVRTQVLDPENPEAPTDAGPFTWVDTLEGIQTLRAHLVEDRVCEIAIDLEHTSYRSYMGLTCLMQISTRWGDWIVDTLADAVREHAELLNDAFADPRKLKILHGADHDVLWMQRDLGLYVVGLFDTYQAAVLLEYPMKGLAYLLERFCDFRADKRYQLADWRIRPLPREMLYYAREDTHDLLYVYDCLRVELRAKSADPADAVLAVFQRSKATAARTYAKDVWDAEGLSREGWKTMVSRYGHMNATPNVARQHWLVRALHRWRDEVARREDESPKYVLGSTPLLSLASKAPRSPQETLNVIRTGPRELKARLGELSKVLDDEVRAFEQHARDEAEALRLAALGVAPPAAAAAGKGDELDAAAYGKAEEDESSDEEEVGTKMARAAEDVDMFEVDARAAVGAKKTAVPVLDGVSTRVVSSPQVAASALWTQSAASASTTAVLPAAAPEKPAAAKRSLFSLPAGFVGRSLFGGGKATAASASASAERSAAVPAVPSSAAQSALFGGLGADKTAAASTSSRKARQIRAGFAAAVGGLLGSGSSSAAAAGAGAAKDDYERAFEAGAPATAAAGTAPSGRALSSVTQKLLSRGLHKVEPASAEARPEARDGGSSAAGVDGEEDPSAFGEVVRVKKGKGKKRGREVEEGAAAESKRAKPATAGFLKPFDLATDASILDMAGPASASASASSVGKAKGGKAGGRARVGAGSGFGPAPRKRNELSSGNRSATFR